MEPYPDEGVIPAFDATVAHHYAQALSAREGAGRPINVINAQVAATCRAHDAVCVTRNTDDFTLTGRDLSNPWRVTP